MIGVLNTRPHDQASALEGSLRAAGFESVNVPLVELELIADALSLLGKLPPDLYDGIFLSSPNLLSALKAAGQTLPGSWLGKPWYLIGPRARAQAESQGISVAFIPETHSLEGFLAAFPGVSGNLRLIHPCSSQTRLDPAPFAAKGIQIYNMAVYDPRFPKSNLAALKQAWPGVSAALFASGSSVHHLFTYAPGLGRTLTAETGPFPIGIGASASRAFRQHGVTRFLQAPMANNEGFVAALKSHFARNPA